MYNKYLKYFTGRLKYILYHFVDLILLIKCKKKQLKPPFLLAWFTGLTGALQKKRISGSLCCFFYVSSFFFFPVEEVPAPAFQSEGGNVLQEEEALQQNQEWFRPLHSSQCGGFNQKSAPWPVLWETNSSQSLQRPKPSEEGGLSVS